MPRLLAKVVAICFCLAFAACGPLANEPGPLTTPGATGGTPPSPVPASPSAQSARDRVEASAVVLYTTREGFAPFPLLAWPELPVLNRPEFSDIYGNQPGIGPHLDDFAPDLNATGSHLLITGIGGAGPGGPREVGAGTWLANLRTGQVRKLWDRPVVAAWSPDGEQLAYVENDTLYLRPSAEDVAATGIFTTAGLWPLFVNWSPNGNWIATVSSEVGETVDGSYPPLTDTLWLVSPQGAPPQQLRLGTFSGYSIEHSRHELQWSPDGSALLVGMVSPNYIVTLDGQQYPLEEGSRGLAWVPDQSNLLVRKGGILSIVDQQGQEILQVSDHFVTAWAFSNDGRYLAYSNERVADKPVDIFVFDLQSEEVRWSGSVPAQIVSSLHWTPTSDALIVGGGDYGTPIWAIGIEPEGEVEVLIEKGFLITVIPRLFPTTTLDSQVETPK